MPIIRDSVVSGEEKERNDMDIAKMIDGHSRYGHYDSRIDFDASGGVE